MGGSSGSTAGVIPLLAAAATAEIAAAPLISAAVATAAAVGESCPFFQCIDF
jgi:hypothetical protein